MAENAPRDYPNCRCITFRAEDPIRVAFWSHVDTAKPVWPLVGIIFSASWMLSPEDVRRRCDTLIEMGSVGELYRS
jgi:hypothetical protein